ncbi:MAG: polyribonucleotide nucleotidyltransferase, partial [Hymenobacter sp.]
MPELEKNILDFVKNDLVDAYKIKEKRSRRDKLEDIKKRSMINFVNDELSSITIGHILHKIEKNVFIDIVNDQSSRIDDRKYNEIRNIAIEVGLLPKTHGSALFTRGETQALVVTTLGTTQDEQTVEQIDGDIKENFMLHYNFPPYSVGEATAFKAPGRREIGHGRLAWRAMQSVLPKRSEFPYTVRIVSEITACN